MEVEVRSSKTKGHPLYFLPSSDIKILKFPSCAIEQEFEDRLVSLKYFNPLKWIYGGWVGDALRWLDMEDGLECHWTFHLHSL